MHQGITEKRKVGKRVEGRNIFHLNKTFLYLGQLIKQEGVHKLFHWSFKLVFKK